MTISFDPSPPTLGSETLSITVKDGSGNAVKGAVVKAVSNMPAMSMAGPTLTFQDAGNGTYTAVTNMKYQTKWILDVKTTDGGKTGMARFDQDVR